MRDLYRNVAVSQPLNPQTATTTKTSSAVDLQGFNSATVLISLGTPGDTLSGSIYWTLKLQESDDNSTYTDVAATGILGGTATVTVNSNALAGQTYSFGYCGAKRYLKAVATATGTHTNGTPMAMLGLRGDANYMPVV